jgi:endonuclease YncB( thermonuclease family)
MTNSTPSVNRNLSFAALVTATAALFAATHACSPPDITSGTTRISAADGAYALDGDTFRVADRRYRIAGIDAPELPGHCRVGRHCVAGDPYAAKSALQFYLEQGVYCRATGVDVYHRTLVDCNTAAADTGADLGALLINLGYASRWPHD